MKDALGERMKGQYEDRTRYSLPRRTYTILRLDGKAFHTLTRGFNKPFDHDLMKIMEETAITLCKHIQGAVLAYTQSDEISILLTDFATPQTEAWFDGNIQKMVSISASVATLAFNNHFRKCSKWTGENKFFSNGELKNAFFDSRVFTIPDATEVANYFIWRQADAVRNSIQMAAQAQYSQKELHGKNTSQLQEMLFQKGINWNNYKSCEKRGTAVVQKRVLKAHETQGQIERNIWVALSGTDGWGETPQFTQDQEFLKNLIPRL